ncbi:hypothetical protein OD91_1878 [Lutibacter sp. Hel_I_33_5]|nr:hypothetical protein OD91_1878 [Lutibacter sp. Hel_I_33_5]
MKSYEIIVNIGNLLLLINTIYYFKSYRKYSVAFKTFTIYLFFSLIIQGIYYVLFLYKENNLFLSHVFFIGQFLILSVFYYQIFFKERLKKIIKLYLIFTLLILTFYLVFFQVNFFKFNLFEIFITSLPIIIYSLLFFFQKIDTVDKKYLHLNSGLFLYLSCSLLLFSAGNLKSSIKNFIWYFNMSLYVIFQILIFIEWYKNFRKPTKVEL